MLCNIKSVYDQRLQLCWLYTMLILRSRLGRIFYSTSLLYTYNSSMFNASELAFYSIIVGYVNP